MRHNKRERRGVKAKEIPLVRASISFPPNVYETLEEIAREKKVSLAWVVRDAAEKYITEIPRVPASSAPTRAERRD